MSQHRRGERVDDALDRLGRDLLDEAVPEDLVRVVRDRARADRPEEGEAPEKGAASRG